MIKKIIKILLTTFLFLFLGILYLSIIGIKTDKFNNQITNNFLNINKKVSLNLNDIKYLLNPYNLTISIKTKDPLISLEGRRLRIKAIQTNVGLRSLLNKHFLIDDVKITTERIKVNDIIALARTIKNSPQLFVLATTIKDGFITADINLNFDENGKIKENYDIKGSVEKAKLKILSQFNLQNLNFDFDIKRNIYSLSQIDMNLNGIKITSPLIEIKKTTELFLVNGKFINDRKSFDIEEFKKVFIHLSNNIEIHKIEFSSTNDFSFNISKNLKISNFKSKSNIDLKELIFNEKNLKLKKYFPSLVDKVILKEHKIIINYDKTKISTEGEGNIQLEEKSDKISYQIIKNKKKLLFNSKIKLKNNSLVLDFLDYKKKEGLDSLILVKGNFKKNNQLKFDFIDLKEKNNKITIKGLNLNESFRITDIESFNVNYKNNKKIVNNINLKKDRSNFTIEGKSFDASKMINNIMNNDEESSSIFHNLNSKISIKIKKTYIDEVNYMNDLSGSIVYNNSKIKNLKLESIFPNKKKINLSIQAENDSETVTKLTSAYPKPLIKRYDFVKGFEEGYLDFYSSKKDGTSNSVLIIDNFKVKEVPIFAKLLSLASLQGMADLLTGEGIRFTDLEMNFSNKKGLITIEEMYAIGPAVSILMEGYIETKKLVSLRGTLVPATTINRSIASIPLLGKILIGNKAGEGIFGVSFKIKGPPKNLKTTVNPIKTLTPRFITRTLEKIKKN
jgi:hypothetical protein